MKGVGLLKVVPSSGSRLRAHQEARSRPGGAPRCPRASQAGSDAPSSGLAAGLQAPTHPETRVPAPGPYWGRSNMHELWESAPAPCPGPIPPPSPLPTPRSAAYSNMDAAPRLQGTTRPAELSWASRASPASAAAPNGPRGPHKRPEPPEAAAASATPPSCSRPARHGAAPTGRGTETQSAGLGLDGWGKSPAGNLHRPMDRRNFY